MESFSWTGAKLNFSSSDKFCIAISLCRWKGRVVTSGMFGLNFEKRKKQKMHKNSIGHQQQKEKRRTFGGREKEPKLNDIIIKKKTKKKK